jgi:hypothetical protein
MYSREEKEEVLKGMHIGESPIFEAMRASGGFDDIQGDSP